MTQVQLVHSKATNQGSVEHVIAKCDLFKGNLQLVNAPYQVQSQVSSGELRDFASALAGEAITINDANFAGLSQLSAEFGFHALSAKLSSHKRLAASPVADCLSRICVLEERTGRHERELEQLQSMVLNALARFEANPNRFAEPDDSHRPSSPAPVMSLPASCGELDSAIVAEYPRLFEEFRAKRWPLLWRGSRDTFTAKEFHRRCDGHANTVTLILDTDGNVFGGFTPLKWEPSVRGKWKGDDTLRSFIFTLRNPHGVPPQRFALKKEEKHEAIWCHTSLCAGFGSINICVCDDCNTTNDSYTHFGTLCRRTTYVNHANAEHLFTGNEKFRVKEIEVFELID
jgi:hypothetical protein